MTENNTDLIKWQPIHAMIEQYNEAQVEIVEGFKLLASAKQRMGVFGNYHNRIIERLDNYDIGDDATENSLSVIKKEAWQGIVDKTQVRNLMTESRVSELDRQLNNKSNGLPELTVENVHTFIDGLASNMDTLLTETIKETFDILRPPRSKYKTNTEFEIGDKVILNYIVEHDKWGFTSLNYSWAEQQLRCIDNVFHLLDGKGPIKWPGDLVTMVRETIRLKSWQCETEYFECKWFKKGSFHMKFKRMDLVTELNRRAGGNRLRKEG